MISILSLANYYLATHIRTELTAATNMYSDMEMTFWLEKAEGAMAEVG